MVPATEKQETKAAAAPEPLEEGPVYTPLVDIMETGDGYTIYADLPGVKAGDLNITYEDDTLTIDAKVTPRQPEDQPYLVREYGVGRFGRSFSMGGPVDPDGIRAELANGQLCLFVPKAQSAKLRKIAVTAK